MVNVSDERCWAYVRSAWIFFARAGKQIEDKRPLEHFAREVKRLLNVIENRLHNRDWLVGDYSIADMATAPWLNAMEKHYKSGEFVRLRDHKNVSAYMDRFNARPAVQRGINVPAHTW